MKKLIPLIFIASNAIADVSSNVTLATDYVFRGLTQTNGRPTIQGGFEYTEGNFSAGTWASNVDFGDETTTEIDFYASASAGPISLGYTYFMYPGQEHSLNYVEYSISYEISDLNFNVIYSDSYWGSRGPNAYIYNIDYGFDVGQISIDLHVGYSDIDQDNFIGSESNYMDYSLGFSHEVQGVDIGVTLYTTNLSNPLSGERLVFSISKDM